jgi:predicted dehydrogenase
VSISVGFIGYKNHAGRLRSIVASVPGVRIGATYHPDKIVESAPTTNEFSEILQADAVVIASPSDTHFHYLELLSKNEYQGYVFCEKPIVTRLSDLESVRNFCFARGRLFVNFNYRFSRFAKLVKKVIDSGALGEPLHLHAVSTQGLAFSSKYEHSWRADRARHPLGVSETKGIHYLNLAVWLFGTPEGLSHQEAIISQRGTAVDTATLSLNFQGGKSATVFVSYAAPLRQMLALYGSNGYVIYEDDELRFCGPRDTFSSQGYFDVPPSVERHSFKEAQVDFHLDSLQEAVAYFLGICERKEKFPMIEIQSAYETTQLLLELSCNNP